jgi:hypothetical protein
MAKHDTSTATAVAAHKGGQHPTFFFSIEVRQLEVSISCPPEGFERV